MNCEHIRQHLELAVEGKSSPPFTEWREHLETCGSCRQLCEDFQLLETAVRDWSGRDREAPDLSDQVLAIMAGPSTSRTSPSPRASYRPWIVTVLASAAALFVIFAGQNQSTDEPHVPTQAVDAPVPVDMERVIGDARDAYGSLLGVAQTSLPPLPATLTLEASEEAAVVDPRDVPQESSLVPTELDPLRNELRQSVGFLTAIFPER